MLAMNRSQTFFFHTLCAARLWMLGARVLPAEGGAREAAGKSAGVSRPFEMASAAVPETALDKLVFGRLEKLKIEAAKPCSDAVFLRRVFLDTIGALPTGREATGGLAGTR